jgi:hypothetical protein
MADPRLAASFKEIGAVVASFKIDNDTITYSATADGGSAGVGLAVTLSADDTIALADDGDMVLGKLLKVESDGIATVQVGGGMTLPAGSGASVTVGKRIVGDQGAASARGYIQELADATGGSAAEIIAAVKARGVIINNDTTTAVVVYL